MNLDLCQHQSKLLIEMLLGEIQHLKSEHEDMSNIAIQNLDRANDLQAELDGMQAGARVDQIMDSSSGMNADEWRAAAVSLNGQFVEWIQAIEARLNAVDTLGSIDGETVRANLTPFINTVRGWMNSVNETINTNNESL